jgi:hypothetical protein
MTMSLTGNDVVVAVDGKTKAAAIARALRVRCGMPAGRKHRLRRDGVSTQPEGSAVRAWACRKLCRDRASAGYRRSANNGLIAVVEYVRSRSMAERLENQTDRREIFSREGTDHIYRFNS